jgi:hypothetical protein
MMGLPGTTLRRVLVSNPHSLTRQRFLCSSSSVSYSSTANTMAREASAATQATPQPGRPQPEGSSNGSSSSSNASEASGSRQEFPAEADARRFRLDGSIDFWRNFGTRFASALSSGGNQNTPNPGCGIVGLPCESLFSIMHCMEGIVCLGAMSIQMDPTLPRHVHSQLFCVCGWQLPSITVAHLVGMRSEHTSCTTPYLMV